MFVLWIPSHHEKYQYTSKVLKSLSRLLSTCFITLSVLHYTSFTVSRARQSGHKWSVHVSPAYRDLKTYLFTRSCDSFAAH